MGSPLVTSESQTGEHLQMPSMSTDRKQNASQILNRNLITFSANAGVTVHEPFLHRDADTFGLGFGFAKVSGFASALDQATAVDSGIYTPIRSSETYIEATYQYQATPWLQIQPDAQYVFTPGGGLADPNNPGHRIGNELVLGVRTNILF